VHWLWSGQSEKRESADSRREIHANPTPLCWHGADGTSPCVKIKNPRNSQAERREGQFKSKLGATVEFTQRLLAGRFGLGRSDLAWALTSSARPAGLRAAARLFFSASRMSTTGAGGNLVRGGGAIRFYDGLA
jgi:hypothetical protein